MRFTTRLMHALTIVTPAPLLRPIFSYRSNRAYQHVLGSTAQESFDTISKENSWSGAESVSGNGSDISSTAQVRQTLPILLKEINATSLLDAPCGDFLWMRHVDLGGIQYIGADIVAPLIEKNQQQFGSPHRRFMHADLTKSDLPQATVVMCRDCFIHLSFDDIASALANIKRSGAKYLLTTTYARMRLNWNIRTGAFRPVNLTLWPFNLAQPLRYLREDPPSPLVKDNPNFDRVLGLWEVANLQIPDSLR